MQGDFSRNSDHPNQDYSGVLMQQGRVQLDADWNEQWRIQVRALRGALRDIIGQHGGPKDQAGFALLAPEGNSKRFRVMSGVYYVDGIRLEARSATQDGEHAFFELVADDNKYLAYLEVWERHVNVIEAPELREVALLGPDTCSRAQVRWAIRLLSLKENLKSTKSPKRPKPVEEAAATPHDYAAALDKFRKQKPVLMAARALGEQEPEACTRRPDARYRGPENQLYRVEVHAHGGVAPPAGPKQPIKKGEAVAFYFKWSRENASVVFPIRRCELPEDNDDSTTITVSVQLAHLGRDARYGLVPGDIVEFVDDSLLGAEPRVVDQAQLELGQAGALGVVRQVDADLNEVVVEVYGDEQFQGADASLHPYLRRWDQREPPKSREAHALVRGAIPVFFADLGVTWFELEDGIEVQFGPHEADRLSRAGDYWSIPARVATGDVIWPEEADKPQLLRPHGVRRHYAPLALIDFSGGSTVLSDLRYAFEPAAEALAP